MDKSNKNILEVRSKDIPFIIRIVRKNDWYGSSFSRMHEKDIPLIEFYNKNYSHTTIGKFIQRHTLESLASSRTDFSMMDNMMKLVIYKEDFQVVLNWLHHHPLTKEYLK